MIVLINYNCSGWPQTFTTCENILSASITDTDLLVALALEAYAAIPPGMDAIFQLRGNLMYASGN